MMNFSVMPSLEHIALLKLTSILWNQHDVEEVEGNFCLPLSKLLKDRNWQKWIKVEDKVIENVSKLPLPESLKNKMLCFVRPLGLQIGTWLNFRDSLSCFNLKQSIEIQWTSHGTINTKKIVQSLVENENLGIKERFEIACTFCLEEHIYSLWPLIPNERYNFSKRVNPHMNFLISYWLYVLRGELHNFVLFQPGTSFTTVHEIACWRSINHGNEMAVRYFFRKLTPIERERSLLSIAKCAFTNRCYIQRNNFFPNTYCTNILCFLLSAMNEEQYKLLFHGFPNACPLLACFFDWPWQGFFSQALQRVGLSTSYRFNNYGYLLLEIQEKITRGFKDYNYKEFFRVLWLQIPHFLKENIINMFMNDVNHSLFALFQMKDEENIKLFLRDATVVVKKENDFHGKGKRICETLMCCHLWDLLKFFIQEYALTKDLLLKLKGQIEKGIVCTRGKEKQRCMLEQFIKIIDELIQKCGKRASEEESYSTKRICSGMLEE